MRKEDLERLREEGWKRALTPSEEAEAARCWADDPEGKADWEVEMATQRAFRMLPRASASSNFTARVLAEIDREESEAQRSRRGAWALWPVMAWRWARPVVYASLVVLLGWGGYSGYVWHQRAQRAESLAAIAEVERMPSVDALKHFEVIRRLDEAATPVDEELLVALE